MQDNRENNIAPSGQCYVRSFGHFLTPFDFKMTILPLEMALESENIPAYSWYFETFDVKHMVSIQAHQKSQLNGKSTPRPGIEPGPPG